MWPRKGNVPSRPRRVNHVGSGASDWKLPSLPGSNAAMSSAVSSVGSAFSVMAILRSDGEHVTREGGKRTLHHVAGLSTRLHYVPAGAPPLLECGGVNLPPLAQIGLVHGKNERHPTDGVCRQASQVIDGVEGGSTRPGRDEEIATRPAQIRRTQLLEIVVTVNVPNHQFDLRPINRDALLVDLHTDGREVLVGEDAVYELPNQAGLADAEASEQADLFLNHCATFRGKGPSVSCTRNDVRRFLSCSASVDAGKTDARPRPREDR